MRYLALLLLAGCQANPDIDDLQIHIIAEAGECIVEVDAIGVQRDHRQENDPAKVIGTIMGSGAP